MMDQTCSFSYISVGLGNMSNCRNAYEDVFCSVREMATEY